MKRDIKQLPSADVRRKSLEEAVNIGFYDFVQELRSTATKKSKRERKMMNQLCNRLDWTKDRPMTLKQVIEKSEQDFSHWRGIGVKGVTLFKKFLTKKGHRFALSEEIK